MGGRYRNRVAGWDVVNEAIDDHNGQLRNTIWRGSIGSDYLDLAFRFAHEADPKAELYLNEYGIEGSGSKTDGILSFARGMLARGVPIHGIGMQAHFELDSKASDAPAQREIEDTMARIAELGLKVRVSEIDVRMRPPVTRNKLAQADIYGDVLRACKAAPNCSGYTTWGMDDGTSWIPSVFEGFLEAHIFDAHLKPKPAYQALLQALQ